jgi:hypothetical protein
MLLLAEQVVGRADERASLERSLGAPAPILPYARSSGVRGVVGLGWWRARGSLGALDGACEFDA